MAALAALLIAVTILAVPRILLADEPNAAQEGMELAAVEEAVAEEPVDSEVPAEEEAPIAFESAPAAVDDPADPADPTSPTDPADIPVEEPVTGGQPDNAPAPSVHDANETYGYSALGAALPSKYDSRNVSGRSYVTPYRNQNPFGTCWSFATVAAIESSMLKRGQAMDANTLDLSERQIAYFTYNLVADALGNTTGDRNICASPSAYGSFGNEAYLSNGGSAYVVSNVLASWIGLANENALPTYAQLVDSWNAYRNDATAFHNATALAPRLARGVNSWRLSNSRRIAMADRADVKKAIQSYGGVAVALWWSWGYKTTDDYGNWSDNTYYNFYTEDTNHLVEIIGWDDNLDRNRFKNLAGASPSKNGAWLIKNSYGQDDWSNPYPYVWVSYEDVALNLDEATASAFEVEPASDYANIYQYDGASGWSGNYVDSGGSIANVFEAQANPNGAERLEAVMFSLSSANVNYSIQVYGNLKNRNNPTSGTALLSRPVTGKTTNAGHYTVKLPSAVTIAEDSLFSVVVTLSHKDGSEVHYDVDATSYESSWAHFESAVSAGQSFERDRAGASWDDLSATSWDEGDEPECAARVKAFTNNVARVNISKASIANVADQTYTGKAITPKPTVTLDGKTLVLDTDYTLSYKNNVNAGTATITVTGKGAYTGKATKTFKIVAKPTPTPTEETVPVYRLYNKKTSEHLYTINQGEFRDLPKVSKGDWVQEGIAWYAPKKSKTPVYRLYNKKSGDHHYTTSKQEADALVARHGWTLETTAFYSDDAKRVPLYRLYNGRLKRGQHHYTADANERNVLSSKHGWKYETIGFYGVKR